MSDTVNFTVRLDKNLKYCAEGMFRDLGMNLSTAITVFLKQAVRQGTLPFNPETDSFWSERNQARLEESLKSLEAGRIVEKTDEELEAMENE
ncbi:MAG: type II toxin-antitoxin system RelB/DinJ family antitoxin [Treponema sp.]|jgi:DNA-damage-inducible protein J|nr:type II toxin-antitoxin system RelB/DinJ family antitoxin [Treponema sp.]